MLGLAVSKRRGLFQGRADEQDCARAAGEDTDRIAKLIHHLSLAKPLP